MDSSKPIFANAFYAENPFLAPQPVPTTAEHPQPQRPAREHVAPGEKIALSIEIAWGDQLLHVAHRPLGGQKPAGDVWVGDDAEGPVEYRLPTARTQVARVEGETVIAHIDGSERALERGERVAVKHGEFTVRLAVVAAARPLDKGRSRSRTALGFWIGSAAVHLAIMGALVMSPGASLDDEAAELDKSTAAYVMQLQKNHADRELAEQEAQQTAATESEKPGGSGKQHAGDPGQMGDPSKKANNAHYEIKGPPDTQEVKMAKVHAMIESNSYGAIGALASVFGATAHAPTAFDTDSLESIGRDKNNFMGNLTGAYGGDSFGYNGLGMYGTALGGGGLYDGIGLGTIGDFGHSGGSGDGTEWGGGKGKKPMKHEIKPLKVFDVDVQATGTLPPETIKRVIRANFPRFRQCYETGLKKDPGLRGTVVARFIIDNTGATETVSLSGGTMGDAGVASCVLGVYRTVSFPAPENGKVMVTYPIDFQND